MQLEKKLFFAELKDSSGAIMSGERKLTQAQAHARKLVSEEPWVWQRGKDRGRFVLSKIRNELPLPIRNRFPTDVVRLVERTDTNRIGVPLDAVPSEIAALLERFVEP